MSVISERTGVLLSLSHKHTVRTSIHNGGVAVEDHSALVQGRDSVQEVEGPQVPLTPAVKAGN